MLEGQKINDLYLSVKEIIVRSSNIGIAQIATLIGKNNQIEFFKMLTKKHSSVLRIDQTIKKLLNL